MGVVKLSITWFKQATRGRGARGGDKSLRITFTDKPKGLRFNTVFTTRLLADDYTHVQIGLQANTIVIRPTKTSQDSFKMIINKRSAQICSTTIGNWAAQQGLIKERAVGHWDDQLQLFIFPFAPATSNG